MRRNAFLLLLAIASPTLAAEPPRLALVIGNSAYQSLSPLPSCAASAATMAASLRRAGFEVKALRDPSNGQMGAAIGTFADALAQAPGAVAVAYACGYAAALENRAFLLPASARLQRESDVLTEGLVVPVLIGAVASAPLRAGLVVLDTVRRPGAPPAPLAAMTPRSPADTTGVLAVSGAFGGPDAPTPAAAALQTALAGPDLEVGALLAGLQRAIEAAPGIQAAVQPPTSPSWLIGGGPPPAMTATAPGPAGTVSPAPAPPAPPAAAAPPPEAGPSGPAVLGELDRRRVQLGLQRLGYYAGQVDGAFGPESLAAIRRFQHELGAEMTGRLSVDQAARLLAAP